MEPDPINPRPSCAHVSTEAVHSGTSQLDQLALRDPAAAVDLMLDADGMLIDALRQAREQIAAVVECVATSLEGGGRLIYVGAGTSGRLGVLDAAECPPTFQSEPEQVLAVLAGGRSAMFVSAEGVEDDFEAGERDLLEVELSSKDVVFGISASASAPYVRGAIALGNRMGARTVLLACVSREEFADAAELSVRVLTGPETLAGSTRLRAGTATKMVLNMVSTLVMARLGKVHGNLMVDVKTTGNAKLWARGESLVERLVSCDSKRAEVLLQAAGGEVKVAVVMGNLELDAESARARLANANGVLREALSLRLDP